MIFCLKIGIIDFPLKIFDWNQETTNDSFQKKAVETVKVLWL
jgi:hypothetical protein